MALYRNARRLPPYATCDNCGEYRPPAVHEDEQIGGHICLCCAAMRAKPNKKTILKCPRCERNNAPFEKHHVWGFKLHRALGREKETIKICLNCHAEITAYLDPVMKWQSLMLRESAQSHSDELKIKIIQSAIIILIAYLCLWNDSQQQYGGDNPNIIHRFLGTLKRSEEMRDAISNLTRKLKSDETWQRQLKACVTSAGR